VDLIELDESFAGQVLVVARGWGCTDADFQRTDVHGSGISLGHPVSVTGGRIPAKPTRYLNYQQNTRTVSAT
jgi:acetyl-CoA C-acetyltransferase